MIYLISGASGSGKSLFAENISCSYVGRKLYLATMESESEAAKKRIEKHRLMRQGKGFETIEKEKDYLSLNIACYNIILLECLSNLAANHIYKGGNEETFYKDINYLISNSKNIIFVTNDISYCAVKYDEEVYNYMKILNKAACYIAEKADAVIEVTAGIPIYHKGEKWVL